MRRPSGQGAFRQCHPTVPKRTLRTQPLAMSELWGKTPRQSFLWQPALSTVPAA
jgi:hypothetical protein